MHSLKKSLAIILVTVWAVSALALVATGAEQASRLNCLDTHWPHEKSDLVPDPALRFGKLENGFRYVVMNNKVPENRIALQFYIGAGSINEKDDERGYAHFLEHMLFNGTENFPPGKLIEYFQSLGMEFGADTNAYTTFDRTVYTILLPENDIEEFRDGLKVVADWARRALLLEEEVERERGVILAEKTARDSVEYRMRVASSENALAGTLLAERQPIGTEEAIKNATAASLRRFYDKWYRPENMILVVVGDIDKAAAGKEIEGVFSAMRGQGPAPSCPLFGSLEERGLSSFYYPEPEAGDVNVSLQSYWNKDRQNDSYSLQMELLKEYMATGIVEKRLDKIIERGEGDISKVNVYSGEMLDRVGYAAVSASTTGSSWQKALALLENVLREALEDGFTATEVEIVKKEIATYYSASRQQAATRKSTELAQSIVWNLSNNRVFQSPEQEWNNYAGPLDLIGVDDVNQALRDLFGHEDRLVEILGNLEITADNPEQLVLQVYREARKQPVKSFVAGGVGEFPYVAAASEPEAPQSHARHEQIDTDVYTFANGTVLNLKTTDFEKNTVRVLVEFGPGKQGAPKAGLAGVAESVVNRSGSGAMTASEIEDALAASSVKFSFAIDKTTFHYKGESLSDEVDKLILALYTLYRDPGFRSSAYRNTMTDLEKMYESMATDVRGIERLRFARFFADGSKLFGLEPLSTIEGLTLQDVKEWLKPIYAGAVPQISVVGEFDRQEVLNLVGRTFAALPAGTLYKPQPQRIGFPEGEELVVSFPSSLDKSLVKYGFGTEGFRDISHVRRLSVLASLFEERVRLSIREKIGAAYSPFTYYTANRFFPDYGILFARIVVEQDKIEVVRQAVREIADELKRDGTTEEELLRIKNPVLTSLRDRVKTNGYWLDTVLSQSAAYPEQLSWPTSIIDDYASVTVAEVNELAKRYLAPQKAAVAVAKPEAGKGE